MVKAAPDYSELVKHGNEERVRQIAEDKQAAADFVSDLIPIKIAHPADVNAGTVIWNEAESAKFLDLCQQGLKATEETELDWPNLTQNERKYYALRIVAALQDKFFPPHRRRYIAGIGLVPRKIQEKWLAIFGIKDPHKEAFAVPLSDTIDHALIHAQELEAKPGHWGHELEELFLHALVSRLHKQKIPIPDTADRIGCQIFAGLIRAAQDEVIPREKHRDTYFARKMLERNNLMERLEALWKQTVPGPALEPTPATNGAHTPEPAAPKQVQAQLAEGLASYSLTELFLAIAARMEASRLDVSISRKDAAEATELCNAAIEENSDLRHRIEALERKAMDQPVQLPAPTLVIKKPLPRVAILGCHLDEFRNIMVKARQLGMDLELKHYDQDTIPVQIKGDYALMLKWASQPWMQKMKESGIPADRRAIVQGGTSRAVMQLEAWFAPADEQAHAQAM